MAARHEVEVAFKLKDEMSVQLENIRKRAAALEKDVKALVGETGKVQGSFAELTKGLDRFAPGLSRTVSGVTDLTKGLSPLAIGLGVAAGALTALGAAAAAGIKELVAVGSELTKLERTTGLSSETLQDLQFAAGQLDIPFDTLITSVGRLEKGLGEGSEKVVESLERMGLSLEQLRTADIGDALLMTLEGLSKSTNQARDGAALFGRQWAEMRLRPDDLEELVEAMNSFTGISDEAKEAGDQLGDEWDRMVKSAKVLALEGVAPLAKEITGFLENLNFARERISKFVSESEIDFARLAEAFKLGGTAGVAFELGRGGLNKSAEIQAAESEEKHRKEVEATNAELVRRVKVKQDLANMAREGSEEKAAKSVAKAEAEAAKAAAEATRVFNQQVDAVRTLDDEIQQLAFEFASGFGLVEETALNMAESWATTDEQIREVAASLEDVFEAQAKIGSEMGFSLPTLEEARALVEDFPEGVGDIVAQTEKLEQAQHDYNQALQGAHAIADLLGGGIGDLVGQTASAAASLANIGKVGFGGLFEQGKGDATGFLGILGGIGGVISDIGPLIGPALAGIKKLFSFGGPDIGRDVGRDIGANISEELEKAIEESGENAQMFLAEIFAEGGLGIDRFAEEVGDLFSMFERGEISETGLIGELSETLPILIENMEDLGPAGEEQIQRIIAAAREMGIEFEGINDLIQSTFAPETMESIAATFDITNDQVRELAGLLGVEVQTELERLAANLGLTVEEFNALGAAVEERFGIPAEQIDQLLASMGVSAEELASALGIEVGGAAGDLTAETQAANAELSQGVGLSAALAANLAQAAHNASSIHIPSFDAGAIPDVSAQGGFHHSKIPRDLTIRAHRGEEVHIDKPGSAGGGSSFTFNMSVSLPSGTTKEQILALGDAIERDTYGIKKRLQRTLGD